LLDVHRRDVSMNAFVSNTWLRERKEKGACHRDNNHHARPASPKLSAFRGEFDPAWPVIRLLVALRLAEVLSKVDEGWENHRRRIPRTVVRPGRSSEGEARATARKDAAA
jgi:hypothetical protein